MQYILCDNANSVGKSLGAILCVGMFCTYLLQTREFFHMNVRCDISPFHNVMTMGSQDWYRLLTLKYTNPCCGPVPDYLLKALHDCSGGHPVVNV
mmetsp:Transcript_15145/g.36372  ORF Transcript_15145/g.36372 Transcript_15145/m.36372 type:complete len:95 (+) Transcript_15145:661-945(+)